MSKQKTITGIPGETIVELVAIKGIQIVKKPMKYSEALAIFTRKKRGWSYYIYQLGFSQFSDN